MSEWFQRGRKAYNDLQSQYLTGRITRRVASVVNQLAREETGVECKVEVNFKTDDGGGSHGEITIWREGNSIDPRTLMIRIYVEGQVYE